ncbi:hypothetical protein [Pseudomonas sp. BNK-44-a]|uniref:hypothetical protein n=1 Tax=Pseudomonas sp. BNK-44-a TaxID=3376178 RepID=UPI0039BEDEDE
MPICNFLDVAPLLGSRRYVAMEIDNVLKLSARFSGVEHALYRWVKACREAFEVALQVLRCAVSVVYVNI